MTLPPPSNSPPPPPINLTYQSTTGFGHAPTLVKLAGIFNLVSAGLDLLHAIVAIAMTGFMIYFLTVMPVAPPPAPAAPGHAPSATRDLIVLTLIQTIPALLSITAAVFKSIGAAKFLRRGKHPWGWGLASGIIGCTEVWMFVSCCFFSFFFIFTVAFGVYTIIILCLPTTQAYLAAPPHQLAPQPFSPLY